MADAKQARITLVKSPIGSQKKQRDTVRALGLLKVRDSRVVTLTPHMQGMINKVSHLLEIEDVDDQANA